MVDLAPDWVSLITIRRMTHKDLPALEWEGEYTHFRRLFLDAYRLAEAGNAVLWVAAMPGEPPGTERLVGQLFVQLNSASLQLADGSSRVYFYSFRVRAELRGLGLGAQLLGVAEQDVRERGFRRVTLNCGRENQGALRFYQRHGYQIVGPDAGQWSYLDHEGQRRFIQEPAWRMEKSLR